MFEPKENALNDAELEKVNGGVTGPEEGAQSDSDPDETDTLNDDPKYFEKWT